MPLSFEKSPRPWRDNWAWRLFEERPKGEPWVAPAAPEDLVEIRTMLRKVASVHRGRLERLDSHRLLRELARIDHLLAVHVCGYEYRPEGRRSDPDWDTSCAWRTGTGTFTSDATEPWSSDLDLACNLVFRYVPRLRLDMRFGGARHGQLRKAHFDVKHPALSGREIPLPEEWPHGVARYPAIAVIDVFLTAFAMQKEAEGGEDASAAAPSASGVLAAAEG